jgi:hypothetical protein
VSVSVCDGVRSELRDANKHNTLFLIQCFDSILLVLYVFRAFEVHLQENFIVHAALFGIFYMHIIIIIIII